jgi:hypothetical protein
MSWEQAWLEYHALENDSDADFFLLFIQQKKGKN